MSEEKKKGLSIFHKILFGILLVPIITILGTLYIIHLGQIEREESLANRLQLQASGISNDIERWSEMNQKVLLQNSASADIRSLNESSQKPILKNIKETYDWTYSAYIVGSDGYIMARSDNKKVLKPDGSKKYYRGDREYYKQLEAGKQFGEQVVLSRTINSPAYVLCAPFDKNALCMASTLSNVSNNIFKTKIGETGFAFLVDNKNKLIAYGGSDPAYKSKLEDMSAHPAIASDGADDVFEYELKGKRIVSYTQKVGNDWTLVIQQNYDEAYDKLIKAKRNALIIFIIAIVLTLLLAVLISRSLSKPIEMLTDITNAYSKGKIIQGGIPGTERSDEIGSLARGVARMGKSIEVMMKQVYSDKV